MALATWVNSDGTISALSSSRYSRWERHCADATTSTPPHQLVPLVETVEVAAIELQSEVFRGYAVLKGFNELLLALGQILFLRRRKQNDELRVHKIRFNELFHIRDCLQQGAA
jgi:hypothetical protein